MNANCVSLGEGMHFLSSVALGLPRYCYKIGNQEKRLNAKFFDFYRDS